VRGGDQRIEQRHHVLHFGRLAEQGFFGLLGGNVEGPQFVFHGAEAISPASQHHDVAGRDAFSEPGRDPGRRLPAFQRHEHFLRQLARLRQAVAPGDPLRGR
jgi:hypothetical protein